MEPEFPKHDKTPNLKLVMNPEGKLHDWRDLPEEEMPDMSQIAYVGNPEIAQTLVSNLNSCQGKGKKEEVSHKAPPTSTPSFAGGFRQIFDNRRGMFEQSYVASGPNRPVQNRTPPTHQPVPTTIPVRSQLVRSKTLPDIPNLEDTYSQDSFGIKRPHVSPSVPKRSSSKKFVAMLGTDSSSNESTMIRRPLRNFFYNA